MNLNEDQKTKVRAWLEEGLKLSDIQNKINNEFSLKLTYMELRFLLDDLKLKPKDPEPPQPTPEELKAKEEAANPPPASALAPESPADAIPGLGPKVSVTVDQLARPGALVSGKVTFSDGKTAEWYLDQTGRLGVTPAEKGYKPSQPDVMAFQLELQNQLARMGF